MAEKVYTIPLKRRVVKHPRVRRAPRGITLIREFLEKHTKAEEVKVSKGINELLWKHGPKKPPGKIKVAVEVKEGKAFARLPDEKLEAKRKEGKKEKISRNKPAEEKETKTEGRPKEKKAETKKIEKPVDKSERRDLTPQEKEAEEIWKEAEEKAKKESKA